MTKAKFTSEELRERRYRQYWESLALWLLNGASR